MATTTVSRDLNERDHLALEATHQIERLSRGIATLFEASVESELTIAELASRLTLAQCAAQRITKLNTAIMNALGDEEPIADIERVVRHPTEEAHV